MKNVDVKMDLPKLEEEILDFWRENNIFKKSIEQRDIKEQYVFYDGPPFATGTPHYGHIVASTMKDVVPRYWTMKGKRVERKWGWDCHGLPIENIAEKELGVKSKKQIEDEVGVAKFNDFCRSKVLSYVDEWKKVIGRLGRWADMDNAYVTMDLNYMESVWWVFKQLWDKGLIYEDYRSMHICPRCETTLSQSEVTEGYKTVKDLSVVAKFELKNEPNTFVLAWTTTPWTLIGNVALAISENIKYKKLKIKDDADRDIFVIIAEDRIADVVKIEYEEIESIEAKNLIGKTYKPLFDYYAKDEKLENGQNGWKIVAADFVTTEEGTGVVHIAPAFGEDDMKLGREKQLPFIQHVGMDGIIKEQAKDFYGLHVKPADDTQKTDVEIIKYLAAKNLLFSKEKYEHSYPHCWRCDTPLLNYATSSWFVKVSSIKNDAIELAKQINWSPAHIKYGRFGKWLEGAKDWSISRQRFWASVIPIWVCGDCGEKEVFASVTDLEVRSGQQIADIHKHVVDAIKFPCQKCSGEMARVPDVLDTWFDSGSMPYAQMHYPFENREKFESNFPAEFIAEGADQTRAWFYYLHVLSSSIFNKPAFKNVIVNGIVQAEDGKKMSKRLQNYPDPMEMFDKYGADVLRFYLMSSPVVAANDLNFSEKEMAELSRGLFRMIWNSYYFFVLYAEIDGIEAKTDFSLNSRSTLDKWIISECQSLIKNINYHMEHYDLQKSSREFLLFADNLSNWYIRRSRKRFWKSENDQDKAEAFETLQYILITLAKLLAPFSPFISEEIYKNLSGEESVHLSDYPEANESLIDPNLCAEMKRTREIVELGLNVRSKNGIKVRQPLAELVYLGEKLPEELEQIIAEEVNVKNVNNASAQEGEAVRLDLEITSELKMGGYSREIVRFVQTLRKKAGFEVNDRIILYYSSDSDVINQTLEQFSDEVSHETLAIRIENNKHQVENEEEIKIDSHNLWLGISREL
ncbi:MAG: Isoleucine--tRNA ligase 2 [bacterium ADurb.Bin212]|nr:MAG: Isoleucine--tRNA ligase 2 [bacterium ADurb.Bin212]